MKSDCSSDRHYIISFIISLKVSCYIFFILLCSKISPVSSDAPSLMTADYKEDTETMAWGIWVAWPLTHHRFPLNLSHLHRLVGEILRWPFIRKRRASLWWGSAACSLFRFGLSPHSASNVCAGGIWANMKWTIKRRSEQVIFFHPGKRISLALRMSSR